MTAPNRQTLLSLLREFKDVFEFEPKEMSGITPTVMAHRLNVDPRHRPIILKKRHIRSERVAVANAEVQRLLKAGFIREYHYPEWILNVVLVKKPNGN